MLKYLMDLKELKQIELAKLDLQRATLAETGGDIPKATEILRGILSFAKGTDAADKVQVRLGQLTSQ